MSSQPIQLGSKPQKSSERARLVRRAKHLAWLGVGWHGVEAAIAVGAGLAASSLALIGFGADSLVESVAGFVLLWRFAAARASSEDAEQRAQKLISMSFYVIAAYVGFEAIRNLLTGERPDASLPLRRAARRSRCQRLVRAVVGRSPDRARHSGCGPQSGP